MARKPIEVTPLGLDPDPLASAASPEGGDLLGKIFDRQRAARLAAAQDEAPAGAETTEAPTEENSLHDSPPADAQRRKTARLQSRKVARLQENTSGSRKRRLEPPPTDQDRRQAITQQAEAMGNSPLRDVASRLPVELDRWLERVAFEYESEHGRRMPKQTLLRLAVQRLFIATELKGSLPELEE